MSWRLPVVMIPLALAIVMTWVNMLVSACLRTAQRSQEIAFGVKKQNIGRQKQAWRRGTIISRGVK
jgi:hypothetical protein